MKFDFQMFLLFGFVAVNALNVTETLLQVHNEQNLSTALKELNITMHSFCVEKEIYEFNMGSEIDALGHNVRKLYCSNYVPVLDNNTNMINKFKEWSVTAEPLDIAQMVIYASEVPGKLPVDLHKVEYELYEKCLKIFVEEDVQKGILWHFFDADVSCKNRFERAQKNHYTSDFNWEGSLTKKHFTKKVNEMILDEPSEFTKAFIFWRLGLKYDEKKFKKYMEDQKIGNIEKAGDLSSISLYNHTVN